MNINKPFSDGAAHIDGQICPLSEAKISVLDWGFLRSDATYDVVHVWNGKFFRMDDHIDRFFVGMKHLHMNIGLSKAAVKQAMMDCVKASGLKEAYVEIICTRGKPKPGSRDPRSCTNQFMVFAIPFVHILDPNKKGLSVIVSDTVRISPRSFDPTVKNYLWLDMVMGLYEAYDKQAESVVLVDEQGKLCEGPGFNIFLVKDNILSTPQHGVLHGITRKTVLEIAETLRLDIHVGDVSKTMALAADEVFATSTAGGVMPVIQIDGKLMNDGEVGELTQQLTQRYWGLHDDPRYMDVVEY